MLDTIYAVETPEGVTINLRPAGVIVRSLAWLIDTLIRLGIYLVLTLILAWADELGLGVMLIAVFLIEWFYPVVFEVLFDGATPGKRAMGVHVVHDNGTPVDWSASVTRNLLRAVDFLPLFYAFGFISMMLNRQFRRMGDLVAGTLVVYRQTAQRHDDLADVKPVAPDWALQSQEAQAIVSFAERTGQFSQERAEELANTSGILVRSSRSATATLQAIARWVVG